MTASADLLLLIESSMWKLNKSLLSISIPRSRKVSTFCRLRDSVNYPEVNTNRVFNFMRIINSVVIAI